MKRWMTSLAPNRRTKFVSFTSRLLGEWEGQVGERSVTSGGLKRRQLEDT